MMDILKYVIKTCATPQSSTVWMAFYLDGKKVVESYSLDIEHLKIIFKVDNFLFENIIEEFEEDVYSNIEEFFKDEEDFSHLLDMRKIDIGSKVFLNDGLFEVSEVLNDYRPFGKYPMVHWEIIDDKIYNQEYEVEWSGHQVLKFKVNGKDEWFIWEDYNYQQSNLYLYLKNIQ